MIEKTRKNRIMDYCLLYSAFLLYSFVSVLAKFAAIQDDIVKTGLFFFAEFVALGVYAIIWQQALKKFDLVVAISNKGITVIFGLVWSVLLFQEKITVNNIIGSALVLIGIGLVSKNE